MKNELSFTKIALIIAILVSYSFSTIDWIPSNKNWSKIKETISNFYEDKYFELEKINDISVTYLSTQFYKIRNHGDINGYLAIAKAPSKFEKFDFFILFNKDYHIYDVQILNYREDWGFEICNKKWLKQFLDVNFNSIISSSNQVQAISGATISVNSIKANVFRINNQLKKVVLYEND